LVRPHLYVLNKMDIADADTNEAVRSTLMQDHGVKDVLFVSCKRGSSIKHKVRRVVCWLVYVVSDVGVSWFIVVVMALHTSAKLLCSEPG